MRTHSQLRSFKPLVACYWVSLVLLFQAGNLIAADDPAAAIEQELSAEDRHGATKRTWRAVKEIYSRNDYQPFWSNKESASPAADKALVQLRNADEHGLSPQYYATSDIAKQARGLKPLLWMKPDATERARFDLRLTMALVAYAQDLEWGRLAPQDFAEEGGYKEPADKVAELAAQLHDAIQADKLSGYLTTLAPPHAEYRRLQNLLKQYRAKAQNGQWTQIPEGPVLELGAEGQRVAKLRQRLLETGDLSDNSSDNKATFDKALEQALRRYQRRHIIEEDGMLGPQTLAALNETLEKQIERITLNMDRWRWLPNTLGPRHVSVNAPEFKLYFNSDNGPALTMRVVLGEEMNPTPLFSDEIDHLILAPYWKIPSSIARKEIVPKLMQDPGYLEEKRLELVQGEEVVKSEEVDWNAIDADNFPYLLRQRPGKDNSLGLIKFMFPNEYAVYMHDTPADHLFDKTQRTFSHGCIRLEKPFELARSILNTESELEAIAKTQASRDDAKPLKIELPKPLPVYITYFTVRVPEGDDQAHFLPDIYAFDKASLERLGNRN